MMTVSAWCRTRVEDAEAQRAVVVEDLGPMFVGAVGDLTHRCALVALADDLEQQVCAVFGIGR